MKKLILSIILVMVICFTTCYANETSFVNNAVDIVMQKIEIPANYTKFNSKITVEQSGQYAHFTWSGDSEGENDGGQISVSVDSKFRIISFSQYFYGDFTGDFKLSSITKNQAYEIAKSFVEKACPEIFPHIRVINQDFSGTNRNFETYEFVFYRYENDIPCFDNYVKVLINPYNSKVSYLDVKWDDVNKIYSPETKYSIDNAKVSMYDKIGMTLEYKTNDNGDLYIRYSPLADGVNYINAYTGTLLNTSYSEHNGVYHTATSTGKDFYVDYSDDVFDISGITDIITKNKYIDFDNTYNLVCVNFYKDVFSSYAMLDFSDTFGNTKRYLVDVNSGNIRFYIEDVGIKDENNRLTVEGCRRIVNSFCKEYITDIFANCKFLNSETKYNNYGEKIYYYNFTRLINGISYNSNGILIGVSAATGKVVDLQTAYDSFENPPFVQCITKAEAFEKYIENVDFTLQYVIASSKSQSKDLRLVYAPSPLIDIYVDATNGNLIDNYGKIVNNTKISFDDIGKDLLKEQILTLTECGIIDANNTFRPNDNITLNEFLLWLCRTVDCVKYDNINDVAQKLIQSGIITFEQLMENAPIDMETGIKLVVSYLGYEELATIPDIYTTGFVDEGSITPEYIGYAAIAKGLKIFEGNAFLPKELMKRNVAAQILYNLIAN